MTPLEQIWTTDVFGNLTAAIRAEHARHARVRKVVPAGPGEPGAYGVVVPDVRVQGGFVGTQNVQKTIVNPTRLRVEFRIRTEELEDLELAESIARRAARQLALAEDLVLCFGHQAVHGAVLGVTQHGAVAHHLFEVEGGDVVTEDDDGHQLDGAHRFEKNVKKAATALSTETARGPLLSPYSTVVTGRAWSDASESYTGSKSALDVARTRFDIAELAQVPDGGEQNEYLVLFPPDSNILDLVEVLAPTCSFRGWTDEDSARMIIESSFVLRIKDPSGIYAVM